MVESLHFMGHLFFENFVGQLYHQLQMSKRKYFGAHKIKCQLRKCILLFNFFYRTRFVTLDLIGHCDKNCEY